MADYTRQTDSIFCQFNVFHFKQRFIQITMKIVHLKTALFSTYTKTHSAKSVNLLIIHENDYPLEELFEPGAGWLCVYLYLFLSN